jgi:hypothetical protein
LKLATSLLNDFVFFQMNFPQGQRRLPIHSDCRGKTNLLNAQFALLEQTAVPFPSEHLLFADAQ